MLKQKFHENKSDVSKVESGEMRFGKMDKLSSDKPNTVEGTKKKS